MNTGIFFFKADKGKARLFDPRAFQAWCQQYLKDGEEGQIEISSIKEKYTLAQLRYLFVSIYKPISEKLGSTPQEVDIICKSAWVKEGEAFLYNISNEDFSKTKDLTKEAFAKYIDFCLNFAAQQGIVCLPPPPKGKE